MRIVYACQLSWIVLIFPQFLKDSLSLSSMIRKQPFIYLRSLQLKKISQRPFSSSNLNLFPVKQKERNVPTTTSPSLGYDIFQTEEYVSSDNKISFDGILDTETRRKQRLKRLEDHSVSVSHEVSQLGKIQKYSKSDNRNINDSTDSTRENFCLGPDFIKDFRQHNSVLSDSPAILLESSAGTGKTTVLAGRVAYLLYSKKVKPQNMILLSFTRRDAITLKQKALKIFYHHENHKKFEREEMENSLWSGTIHSFAINVLKKYNSHNTPLRIISTREMRNRIRQCLGRINSSSYERMVLYKKSLDDANQSIGVLVQHILRCLELWKEAGVLPSPYVNSITFSGKMNRSEKNNVSNEDFIELAMRLGIPQSAAELALEISGDYQTLHASMGTSDPADVATIAYEYLLNNPKTLNEIRSKLHQVVLDEYQDVSVSQHQLLRLIVNGIDDIQDDTIGSESSKFPILMDERKVKKRTKDPVCFNVPKLCAAGDANQSIYGWRGAAPSLTVDGFQKDFPQGIVVPLNVSYRLPRNILNAANVLIGNENRFNEPNTRATCFDSSPAAIVSKKSLVEKHAHIQIQDAVMNESKSSVIIQGLWDVREEAKYIASTIRKRAKTRIEACASVFQQLSKLEQKSHEGTDVLFDSSDVAIMVRSSKEVKLFMEALEAHGIPYTTSSGDESSISVRKMHYRSDRQFSMISMKPVKLITMHQAKGDEFDDVYLASWTEGNFPHPSSVFTNRVHEERRIAYVALTRARQQVIITYSFMTRTAYFGPKGERKDVTEQVEPSRFLYDIMPDSKENELLGVEWNDGVGFKEVIAGRDLPQYYRKSYKVPDGFRTKRIPPKQMVEKDHMEKDEMFETLQVGLNSIFEKKRGACKKYRPIFREFLRKKGIIKGRALVLAGKTQDKEVKDIFAVAKASKNEVTTRPLSKCTAKQLGLYLISLLKNKSESNK